MTMSPIHNHNHNHNHDLAIVRGGHDYKPSLPAGSGTEPVGVVDAPGQGVLHLAQGQRVTVTGASATWAE